MSKNLKTLVKTSGMATPEGLEPPTSALGKPCSIRLSYGVTGADLASDGAAGKRLRALPFPFCPKSAGSRGGRVPWLWLIHFEIQYVGVNKPRIGPCR